MKKFIIMSILTASLSTLSYASDPCDTLAGHWYGRWQAFGYSCTAEAEGIKSGTDVYFNFQIYNCGIAQGFAMSGHCTAGQLLLANSRAVMNGPITSNQFTIQGNGQWGAFSKY